MANPAIPSDQTSTPITDINPLSTNPLYETSDNVIEFVSDQTSSFKLSFNFRQDKWPEFKAQFTQYLIDNGITISENKRAKLLNAFDEDTYALVRNMCIPTKSTDTDYYELIRVLDCYFEPVDSVFPLRDKFYKAHRLNNESVTEWSVRLKSLALSCKFEHDWSNVMGDIFVTGMGDGPIKEYIMQMKHSQHTTDSGKTCTYFTTLLKAALDKEAALNVLGSFKEEPDKGISSKPKISSKTVSGKNDFYYKINKNRLGLAVIFNHETFCSPDLDDRAGTRRDEIKLELTLSKLGFEVTIHNNLRQHELIEWIKHYSTMDHSEYSCFVMCILTHGSNGRLWSKDKNYKYNDIISRFAGNYCVSLAGKPKLFFIQACRGNILDPGYTIIGTDCESESYKIPIFADILIAYSTAPGHKAFREGASGSFFIKALCDVLNQNAYNHNLLTLLTMVNCKVAIDYESYSPYDPDLDGKKQMPCVESMLTRVFKFPEN